MALSAHVGSFNIGLGVASSTVPVTGVGFLPKAIIFWWNGRTGSTDGVGRATHRRGFGFTTGTAAADNLTCVSISVDASATSDAACGVADNRCVAELTTTPGFVGSAALTSFDSDGFTLVINDEFVTNLRVHYLALGGDAITDVDTGVFTPTGTAPVTQDITSLAFQPDLVFFLATELQLTADGTTIDSVLSFGVANASQARVWAGGSNDGLANMRALSYCRSGECIARFNTLVSLLNDRAEFTTFLSNGFRINWLERSGAGTVAYLALKGLSSVIGDLLTQTDTTTAIQESGFGFAPSAALFVSASRAESAADTLTDHDQWSMGAASSATVRNAAAVLDENAVADSEVTIGSEFDAVYANIAADSTIQGLMDVQSFDSGGFTCIMDDADPAQNYVWYVALGPAAGAEQRRFVLH